MKKITLSIICALLAMAVLAQAPQGISHQAVIRNAANQLVINAPIGIQVSIIQGSADGTVVYSETHTPQSNANGLISFVIGQGTVVSGGFAEIDWSDGPYFIETKADPNGGTNYAISSVTQFLSVPYALFSEKAEALSQPFTETDPVFESSVAADITGYDIENWNNKQDRLQATLPGEMLFWDGEEWLPISPGEHNQLLRFCNGRPTWGNCKYLLSLVVLPEDGGVVYGSGQYEADAQINISVETNEGWIFLNWSDENGVVSNSPNFVYTMLAADVTLTANFEMIDFTLTLVSNPIAGGSVNGGGVYNAGNEVQIEAVTNTGWEFLNWSDANGIVSEAPNFIYTMPAVDVTLTANFESDAQPLQPCPGTPTVTDIDGNTYNTVIIGNQCWMNENLRTTHYNNGTPIEYPDNDFLWNNNTTGAYAWYDHDINWKDAYGALYNWYAVRNENGLCPTGWHVPSDGEWNILVTFIDPDAILFATGSQSITAGGQLKSTITAPEPHPRWDSPNTGATNEFNWNGFAAGFHSFGLSAFIGRLGRYWSASELSSSSGRTRSVSDTRSDFFRGSFFKTHGISVRCLRDEEGYANIPQLITTDIYAITTSTAISDTHITSDGNSLVVSRGVVWGVSEFPTLEDNEGITFDGSGGWLFTSNITGLQSETTYYLRAYATNNEDTGYGNQIAFETQPSGWEPCQDVETITDIDGNVYETIQIGVQCWMKENLKTTHYRNGTPIDYPDADNNAWQSNKSGAYAWYDNDISWKDRYGALYNWHALNNANGLCPIGWHVPTDAEWTVLTTYVSGQPEYLCNINTNWIAKSLAATADWVTNTVTCAVGNNLSTNNATGFSGLPGGYRYSNAYFYRLGLYGYWWSSTDYSSTNAWIRYMGYSETSASRYPDSKVLGLSVRCLRD
jgi:uncharacterized protein (TIGR02145 family)